jgi:hypothetical protein
MSKTTKVVSFLNQSNIDRLNNLLSSAEDPVEIHYLDSEIKLKILFYDQDLELYYAEDGSYYELNNDNFFILNIKYYTKQTYENDLDDYFTCDDYDYIEAESEFD